MQITDDKMYQTLNYKSFAFSHEEPVKKCLNYGHIHARPLATLSVLQLKLSKRNGSERHSYNER